MIERDFDIPFISDLALREKQIQQNYRPAIAVHKWFARRPEVKDELKAARLTLITDDEESTVPVEFLHSQGEINIIPLWKWLLGQAFQVMR